jgi:hypothetical protein
MSYAMVPVGASLDVSSYIGGSAGQQALSAGGAALTQSGTLSQITSTVPGASDVASDWGPAIGLASKAATNFPSFQKDPGKAVAYGLQTIPGILNAAGVSGAPADIAAVAAGLAPQVGALIDGHPGPVVMAGIKSGTAYACQQLGISPELGIVTVDQIGDILKYGEINNQTLEAAGGLGGAAGGAALCSLIGVPPCIGGFLGGIAGKAVGGAIGSIFHIGGGKQAREEKQREWQAAASQFSGELDAIRAQYSALLVAMRGTWWSGFDSLVNTLSLQWTGLECSMAYSRFPLLWSGQGNVNPYFIHPYNQSLCTIPINRNLARGTGCLDSNGILSSVTATGCMQPYGCPYPTFPTIGAEDQYSERVVQALASYDIWWQPDDGRSRQAIDQMWVDSLATGSSQPNDPTVRQHQRNESWVSWLADEATAQKTCKSSSCKNTFQNEINTTIGSYRDDLDETMKEATAFDGVQAALARIIGDLCTTAGIYAAAVQINANQSALIKGDLSQAVARQQVDSDLIIQMNTKYASAARTGRYMNTAINYAMLAAGGALLGHALWRRR